MSFAMLKSTPLWAIDTGDGRFLYPVQKTLSSLYYIILPRNIHAPVMPVMAHIQLLDACTYIIQYNIKYNIVCIIRSL
jgi:hypothetical protein